MRAGAFCLVDRVIFWVFHFVCRCVVFTWSWGWLRFVISFVRRQRCMKLFCVNHVNELCDTANVHCREFVTLCTHVTCK